MISVIPVIASLVEVCQAKAAMRQGNKYSLHYKLGVAVNGNQGHI